MEPPAISSSLRTFLDNDLHSSGPPVVVVKGQRFNERLKCYEKLNKRGRRRRAESPGRLRKIREFALRHFSSLNLPTPQDQQRLEDQFAKLVQLRSNPYRQTATIKVLLPKVPEEINLQAEPDQSQMFKIAYSSLCTMSQLKRSLGRRIVSSISTVIPGIAPIRIPLSCFKLEIDSSQRVKEWVAGQSELPEIVVREVDWGALHAHLKDVIIRQAMKDGDKDGYRVGYRNQTEPLLFEEARMGSTVDSCINAWYWNTYNTAYFTGCRKGIRQARVDAQTRSAYQQSRNKSTRNPQFGGYPSRYGWVNDSSCSSGGDCDDS